MHAYDRDDPTFVEDLKRSDEIVTRVARWFAARGYQVRKPELRVRPTAEEMASYRDGGDLYACKPGEPESRIEVTARTFDFTCRADYPHPIMLVDTVHAWNLADPKPALYLRFNCRLTHAAMIDGSTHGQWWPMKRFDRARGRERSFWMCSLDIVNFRQFAI